MFRAENPTNDRVEVELSGKLTSEEMRILVDDLVSRSRGMRNGKMRIFIRQFEMPSLGAIGVELSRLPTLFGLIRKFDRVVVLADKRWLKKISEIEGRLIPGVEIKAFELNQSAEAEVWLSQ